MISIVSDKSDRFKKMIMIKIIRKTFKINVDRGIIKKMKPFLKENTFVIREQCWKSLFLFSFLFP